MIDKTTRADILKQNPKASKIIKPFLNGRNVRRYRIEPDDCYLIYTHHGINMSDYPAVIRHLKPYAEQLKQRATRQEWYELQQPQLAFAPLLDGTNIIFPDIATEPRFALDEDGHYGSNTTYFIPLNDLYLLGLLNSKLAGFYFRQVCAGLEGKNEIYLRFFGQYLEGFPVRIVKSEHGKFTNLVKRMLGLNKQLAESKTAHDKTLFERQIAATDRQIDDLVYEFYGLTDGEIKIVEGAAAILRMPIS